MSLALLGSLENLEYLQLVVGFSVFVYFFHTYLDIRQYKALNKPSPPVALQKSFANLDDYKKTQAYNIDKWWFGIFQGNFSFLLSVACLLLGYYPWLWDRAGDLIASYGYDKSHETTQTVVFILLDCAKDLVLGLPWSAWSTFRIEQRHGFNKQTPSLFVKDKIKGVILGLLLLPPVIAALTQILLHAGPYVALYMWGFILLFSLFAMTIYPVIIAPLFNKFSNLEKGPLRKKIEDLAGSLKFPLTKLYVVDGSTRSAHSNAYMYGLWKNKRIVLYDTLIQQCKQEEVVAVLAHELGHWKLGHTPMNFVIGQAVLLLQLSMFTLVRNSSRLFRSFGFVNAQPVFVSFILFQQIIQPVDEVIGFLTNLLSRRYEYQADGFAVSLGHAATLKEALLKLNSENKSASHEDAFYSAYHHSHPSLVERLKAIDAAEKKFD